MPDFPIDEFEQLAADRGPVGVHRKRRNPLWRALIPVFALIIGGAVAFAIATAMWKINGGEGLPPTGEVPTPTITQTHIAEPTETPEPQVTESESPEPEPTFEEPPAPVINFNAAVSVLNGAGIQGLAGRQQSELEAAGFTAVTATNLTGSKPAVNTVRYGDASQADTAQRIAEVLGITAVEQGTTTGAAIDVLLVTDPDK